MKFFDTNKICRVAKNITSSYDEMDRAIEASGEIIELIEKNRLNENDVKRIVKKYRVREMDYLIEQLENFDKFNGRYSSSISKAIRILNNL